MPGRQRFYGEDKFKLVLNCLFYIADNCLYVLKRNASSFCISDTLKSERSENVRTGAHSIPMGHVGL